jgi:hypothetical protein
MTARAQGLGELSGLPSRADLRIQLVPVDTGLKCRYDARITRVRESVVELERASMARGSSADPAERILTTHPQGKKGVSISRQKYDVMSAAISRSLRETSRTYGIAAVPMISGRRTGTVAAQRW